MKNISLIALPTLLLLAACSGPEDEFENAINASFAEDQKCWNITKSGEIDFPISVKRAFMTSELHPILAGLERQGLVTLQEESKYGVVTDHIDLTAKGRDTNVWQLNQGFCVGRPQLVELVRFTYGDNGANENSAVVEYTWELVDKPSWLDASSYSDVRGMTAPVEDQAIVQKSSDGWHVR